MEQGWCKFETSGKIYDYLKYKEVLEQISYLEMRNGLSQGETKCEVQCSSNRDSTNIHSHWGIR